jgi:putative acetyltransferase
MSTREKSAERSDRIIIARADFLAEPSRLLIEALNTELTGAYPEPGATHFGLTSDDVAPGRGAFLIMNDMGTPVGCGAVRLLDAETSELKRMYAAPAVREHGLGRRLVAALEVEARVLGARRIILETGIRQTAAIALYRACGFTPIPLDGEYLLSPQTSVCLGKALA